MKFRAYNKKWDKMLPTLTMKEICITQGTLDFDEFEDLEIKQVINIQGIDICEDFDIVEFNYYQTNTNIVKLKATLHFHQDELRYELHILEPKFDWEVLSYNYERMKNFKVVGDIYEK